MKLSAREKIMVVIAGLLVCFLVFWYGLLNPILLSIDKATTDIKVIKAQLKQAGATAATPQPTPLSAMTVLDQEAQSSRLVNFISQKLDQLGIKLVSIRPTAADNRLTVDLQFTSSYNQLLGFVNALPKSETLLVIDEAMATVGEKDNRLLVNMRLLSAYR